MLRVFTSSCQSGFLCLCVHLSQHIPRLRNESLGRLSQFLYDRWPVRLPPLHWLYHPPLAILGEVDRSLRRQWKEFDVEIWFHSDISLRSEVLWHSVRHLHLCWLTICISSCNKMPAAKGKSPRFGVQMASGRVGRGYRSSYARQVRVSHCTSFKSGDSCALSRSLVIPVHLRMFEEKSAQHKLWIPRTLSWPHVCVVTRTTESIVWQPCASWSGHAYSRLHTGRPVWDIIHIWHFDCGKQSQPLCSCFLHTFGHVLQTYALRSL